MVGSKVFHTVMPPEGAVVGLRGGIQELEDYLELGDPKGNHSHLIEGKVILKPNYHPELCTEGMQATPLAGHWPDRPQAVEMQEMNKPVYAVVYKWVFLNFSLF